MTVQFVATTSGSSTERRSTDSTASSALWRQCATWQVSSDAPFSKARTPPQRYSVQASRVIQSKRALMVRRPHLACPELLDLVENRPTAHPLPAPRLVSSEMSTSDDHETM